MATPAVEDRFAIEDLFVRYARALDDGDVDGIVACFSEDASLDSPIVGKYEGHAGIRAFGERYAKYREAGTQTRHFITNLSIDVRGTEATAYAYLLCGISSREGTRYAPPAVYDCTLVQVNGRWLFRSRRVAQDADNTLPGI
jgi:ketosteroid isomerase-like protein